MKPLQIEFTRGDQAEIRHQVHALWLDDRGKVIRSWGDEERLVCPRSAFKPVQAIPLAISKGFEKSSAPQRSLAIACASHLAQDIHLETVRTWLEELGRSESDLVCGPQEPKDPRAIVKLALDNKKADRVYNNCSGKHTGFLATCLAKGWDFRGYHLWDHPLQVEIRRVSIELSGLDWDRAPYGIDGCGIPTYHIPLISFGVMMSRFLRPESTPYASAMNQILSAWAGEPYMIGGKGELGSEMIHLTRGRLLAKIGALGNYVLLDRERGRCLVMKVEDGAERAVHEALLSLLAADGGLTSSEEKELRQFAPREIRNWAGEVVGEARVHL